MRPAGRAGSDPGSAVARAADGPGASTRRAGRLSRWTAYAIVGAGALVMLAPFWFMFVFATHSRTEIMSLPPPLWFGDSLLDNLRLLGERIPFWRSLGWSLYVAVCSTALTLLFCSMGGYAFAMFEFRFKQTLFALVMATLLLPSFMNMIPTFMIMDLLDWIDRPIALYIPGAASAFGIFLMRQFIAASVPRDLIEAARMDGANGPRIFWYITLPHLGRAIAVVVMIETIFLLQVFAEILVTTNGGPGQASMNLPFFVYMKGLLEFDVGGASAAGLFAVLIANIVAIFLIRTIGRTMRE